jgi:hypothetical protein
MARSTPLGFIPKWRCLYCRGNHDPRGCQVAKRDRSALYAANQEYRKLVLKFIKKNRISRGAILQRTKDGEIFLVKKPLWHTLLGRYAVIKGERILIWGGGFLEALEFRTLETVVIPMGDIEGFEVEVEGESLVSPTLEVIGGALGGMGVITYPKLGAVSEEDWLSLPKSDRKRIWRLCRKAAEDLP